MEFLIAGAAIGAGGMIILYLLKGSVKLFTPRSLHASIDQHFHASLRFVGRWFGRALVLFVVGLIGYVWWIVSP